MKDKCTILIVDDDHAHRTMLNTLVSGWGYIVSEADDGSTAIDNVKASSFDLVLMDVRMVHWDLPEKFRGAYATGDWEYLHWDTPFFWGSTKADVPLQYPYPSLSLSLQLLLR